MSKGGPWEFLRRWVGEVWRIGVPFVPFVAAFVVLDLGWATMVNVAAEALQLRTFGAKTPGQSDAVDALWHLGTGLLLALPSRDRRLYVLAPVLSLGLDVDHVFGLLVPAAVSRPSHSLLFVAVGFLLALVWKGRTPALALAGAVLTHFAVDGGSLPLLDPVSFQRWLLPPWAEAMLLLLCGGLFLLARDPKGSGVGQPRAWAELVGITAVLVVFLYLAGPMTWYSLLSG